jgi:hypothetical protein
LAKPHRIRRACICILLSVRECRQGRGDHDNNESNGAQFTHDVHSSLGLGVATIAPGFCSHNLAATDRAEVAQPETELTMNIFYIIGVVVVVLIVAGFLGPHV